MKTFKNELTQLALQYPHFQYLKFISSKKRIGKNDLCKDLNGDYYICGPDSLKGDVIHYLKELNISKSKVYIEHFADGDTPWFGLLQ